MSASRRPTKQIQTVETSLGTMKYKVVDFLRAIEKRPTVYDLLSDAVDGTQILQRRQEKWAEIGAELFPSFKKLPESEQRNIITLKLKRCWNAHQMNLLKFVRAKQSGDPNFKTYTFSKEMDFYAKYRSINANDTESPCHEQEEDIEKEEPVVQSPRKQNCHVVDDIVKKEIINSSFIEEDNNHNISKKTKLSTDKTPETISTSTPNRSERLRQRNSNIQSTTVKEPVGKAKRGKKLHQDTVVVNEEADNTASVPDPILFCQTTANGSIDQDESPQQEEISCDPSTRDRSTRATPFVQIPAMYSVVDDESDKAFFQSIKPSLRKMDESQKLDFQIDILQLVKKYQSLTGLNYEINVD